MRTDLAQGQYFFANPKEVEFNQSWHNGTGYLHRSLIDPIMEKHGVYFTKDEKGRRITLVSGPYGRVAIFDRYKNGEDGIKVFNCSKNYCFEALGMRIAGLVGGDGNPPAEVIWMLPFLNSQEVDMIKQTKPWE